MRHAKVTLWLLQVGLQRPYSYLDELPLAVRHVDAASGGELLLTPQVGLHPEEGLHVGVGLGLEQQGAAVAAERRFLTQETNLAIGRTRPAA